MANRDANKIKRTIQDFSLNVVGGGEGGSGIFTVTLTLGENLWLEQDKTNEEIYEALGKGPVYFVFNREGSCYLNGFVIGGDDQYNFVLLTDFVATYLVTYHDGHFYLSGGPM